MIRGWAISRLGLSREEFYLMRPGEFWEAIMVWQADKEADRRHVAEVIRSVGIRLFNIQLALKDRIRNPHDFIPFPWDEEYEENEQIEKIAKMSDAERTANANSFLDRINWKK